MADKAVKEVIWITGGGTGIGKALALEYAGRGATVAVSGRRREPLEQTREAIEKRGGTALVVPCDVTKVTELEGAVTQIVDATGRLDVVVANAGFSVSGPFEELSQSDWKRQFDVNVFGLVMTVRAAIPHLRQSRGRIVLMGSVSGMVGLAKNAPYSASKFAVRGIGQSLNVEFAGTGITCTTLMPGFVESEIAQVDNRGQFHEEWEDRRPAQLVCPSDRAARSMRRAIDARKKEAVITGHGKFAAFMGNHAPRLTQTLMGRFAKKARQKDS